MIRGFFFNPRKKEEYKFGIISFYLHTFLFLKRSFLRHGKKRSRRNTIIYNNNLLNGYFSQNIQFLFRHTDDRYSNAIILFKTDLYSALCLLEIGQSTFPNFTTQTSKNLAWIFWNFRIFQRWLFGIYSEFKAEILKCGLTDLKWTFWQIHINFLKYYRIIRSIGT